MNNPVINVNNIGGVFTTFVLLGIVIADVSKILVSSSIFDDCRFKEGFLALPIVMLLGYFAVSFIQASLAVGIPFMRVQGIRIWMLNWMVFNVGFLLGGLMIICYLDIKRLGCIIESITDLTFHSFGLLVVSGYNHYNWEILDLAENQG